VFTERYGLDLFIYIYIHIYIAGEIWSSDRAIVQEGSCWSLTAEAWVRPMVSSVPFVADRVAV